MRKILLLLNCILCCSGIAHAGRPPVAQWHFDGNRIKGDNLEDWVFSLIPTQDKGYIACGYTVLLPPGGVKGSETFLPVIFKLDNLGNLVWTKVVTSATGPGGGAPGYWGGILLSMVKTPDGYAAGGYIYNGDPNGGQRILIVEVNEEGDYLNTGNMVYRAGNAGNCRARAMAMSPDGADYIVAGELSGVGNGNLLGISKISYRNHAVTAVTTAGGDFRNHRANNAYKIVCRPTSGATYDIFACGFCSASDIDGKQITGLPNAPTTFWPYSVSTSEVLTINDKDIWLLKLDQNLANPVSKTYPKSALSPIPANTPTGPASARNFTNTNGVIKIAGSELAGRLAEDYDPSTPDIQNYFEKATDLILDKDGNLVLVAMVNCLMDYDYFDGNGRNLIQSTNGLNPSGLSKGFVSVRSATETYYYDEYSDADVYILNIDPASCAKNWDKFIGHMSSKDFYPRVIQDGQGNYIVAGSTADFYTRANAPDLTEVEYYDAFLVSTPNTPGTPHNWRRNVHAHNEEGVCIFALAPTADGGFIIGGDNPGENELNNDNFSITKFAPACAPGQPFHIPRGDYVISANTSWPDASVPAAAKIAGRVIVRGGATLTIDNSDLQFASADHLYDYWDYGPDTANAGRRQVGILVEPGGTLIVRNTTLRGLDDCNSNVPGNRFMWDGIIVKGDPKAERVSSSQGSATLLNATIRDARIGTLADYAVRGFAEQTRDVPADAPAYRGITSSSRYSAAGSYGGGIIHATNTRWTDCRFSVSFQQHNLPGTAANTFDRCTFEATADGMADPCFYAAPDGTRLPASTFFGSWDVQRTSVSNSVFTCDSSFLPARWPTGISAPDASLSVKGNTFRNLKTGIQAMYSAGLGARSLRVYNNTFTRNGNGLNVAGSMNALTASGNTFYIPGNDLFPDPCGILLQNCTGYNVGRNTFDKAAGYASYPGSSRGIQVSFGDSWTNYNNTIQNNTFNNLRNPVIALQKNSSADYRFGLQLKCNDYLSGNSRGIARLSALIGLDTYIPATIKSSQGFGDRSANVNQPTENRFYTTCNNANSTVSRERLYADAWVDQTVSYYVDPGGPEYDPGNACTTPAYYSLNLCPGSVDHAGYCDPSQINIDPEWDDHAPTEKPAALDEKIRQAADNPALLSHFTAERDLVVNAWVRYYNDLGAAKSAAGLLEQYGRFAEALPFRIGSGDWTGAESDWNNLPAATEDERDYTTLTRMTIDLLRNGKTWKDIGTEGRAVIRSIAGKKTYPGYMAATVADLLQLRPFAWPYAADLPGTNDNRQEPEAWIKGRHALLHCYPNPTSGSFTVVADTDGELCLYDVQGRRSGAFRVHAGDNKLQLNDALAHGVYFGRFTGTDGTVREVKLFYNR